jgi:hypothetical protein
MLDMVNVSTGAHESKGQAMNTIAVPNIGMVCKNIPLHLRI